MIKQQYKKIFKILFIVLVVAFIGMQFIPSSFSRVNPPVTGEPAWDSQETRATFLRTCGDCHSNETRYPWYSTIAPASMLIESDIRDGRKHFNVSAWNVSQRGGDDAAGEVRKGSMPVGLYLLMHPEANLNPAEKKKFVEGLEKTFEHSSTGEKEENE
jgi:hypothetical protein